MLPSVPRALWDMLREWVLSKPSLQPGIVVRREIILPSFCNPHEVEVNARPLAAAVPLSPHRLHGNLCFALHCLNIPWH